MNLLGSLLSWFTGGGLTGLASELNDAYKARLSAQTDKEKLAADERMNLVQARVAAQTTGPGSFSAKTVRALFAVPFIIYVWKLVIWDKVLKLGTTEDLSSDLWKVFIIILTFYFLDNTIRFIKR